MFDNLLNYYLQDAQYRINKRIEAINEGRMALKASGDKRYKNLRELKNSHLYENKPKIIKEIRGLEAKVLADKLTITVAESLLDNIKLKPNFMTISTKPDDEMKMKKSNLEFLSLQEILWGIDDSFMGKDKFNFILNLFLDLVKDKEYLQLIHNVLLDYIPYAKFMALEKSIKEDFELDSIFAPNYKNNNVDVFAEAVYAFCMTNESDEMMIRFIKFLQKPYTYESKDKEGRFLNKTVEINFQNFEQAFCQTLSNILEPLSNMETYCSLGKRAYDIIMDDFRIDYDLLNYSMVRSPESYGHYLTKSEKNDIDVMSDLLEASKNYIDKLMLTQQDFYGNIEQLYFESDMFIPNATQYFSEERFFQLLEQKQLDEIEASIRNL